MLAKRPFAVNGNEIAVTACFGIAESLGRSPLMVLRDAERALTMAKQTGPNTVRFFGDPTQAEAIHPEMRRRMSAS